MGGTVHDASDFLVGGHPQVGDSQTGRQLPQTLEQLLIVESVFAGAEPTAELPRIEPSDLCFLQFTSGSTSIPSSSCISW